MEEKKLTVTFVNVGYGEAILLESPDPSKPDGVFTALIDGGSASVSFFCEEAGKGVAPEVYVLNLTTGDTVGRAEVTDWKVKK